MNKKKKATKICKYWKWDKNNPRKSVLDNPHKQCYKCSECEAYTNYVAEKMAGHLN